MKSAETLWKGVVLAHSEMHRWVKVKKPRPGRPPSDLHHCRRSNALCSVPPIEVVEMFLAKQIYGDRTDS